MSESVPPPLPPLLPESAPFSPEQRAWLNGFFAGFLGLDGNGITALSPEHAEALLSGIAPLAQEATMMWARRPGTTRPCRFPTG